MKNYVILVFVLAISCVKAFCQRVDLFDYMWKDLEVINSNQDKNTNAIFQANNNIIANHFYPSIDWTDFDNDNDLDFIISGAIDLNNDDLPDSSSIKIYKNDNGVFVEYLQNNIYNLHSGVVKFMDIDNDGDSDLLTSGVNYADVTKFYLTVYENNNNLFTIMQQLEPLGFGSIDYGDVDNDGDLDLLVNGLNINAYTKIYLNNNGVFSDSNITLPAVESGKSQFADFDQDGDLDILIMGNNTASVPMLKILNNTDAVFTEQINLPGLYEGSFSICDYDNDADLDFAVIGVNESDNNKALIYENSNNNFTEFMQLNSLKNISKTALVWGDYNNDGLSDLIISGSDENLDDFVFAYKNNQNSFILDNTGLPNIGGYSALAFKDFDNDNDLDILISGFNTDTMNNYTNLTGLFNNGCTTINNKPMQPTNLVSSVNTDNSVGFRWDRATDDFTPTLGLYYYLTVGSSQNSSDIATYKVYGNKWKIKNIPTGNYYWSVQAIDASENISEKASTQFLGLANISSDLSNIFIFPNPAQNTLNIRSSSIVKNITISNSIGQIVFTKSTFSNDDVNKIDLANLVNGIYFVNIETNTEKLLKKIIKN